MALAAVGHSQFIDNIDEKTKEADVCKLFYDTAKQELLRLLRPQFAQKWVKLALITENPSVEWEFAYQYPTDALKVLRIPAQLNNRIPWEYGTIGSQKAIMTNQAGAEAVIIHDVSEQFFDSSFGSLLALNLARSIAMPLSIDQSIQRTIEERYLMARGQAMAAIENERQQGEQPDSGLVTAYYGYGSDSTNRG